MKSTTDDLLSLLSIYRECTESTRQNQPTDQNSRQQKIKAVNDWGYTVTTLPEHRNNVAREMAAVCSSLQRYHDCCDATAGSEDRILDASILHQLETTAMNLRGAIQVYLTSIPTFQQALNEFWSVHDSSAGLDQVGNLLASQLIDQLKWDEGLMYVVVKFLDEEMYNDSKSEIDELRVYADAFSAMLKIDKSFWKMVQRQALEELKLIDGEADDSSKHLNKVWSSVDMVELYPSVDTDYGESDNVYNEHSYHNNKSLHELIVSEESVQSAVEIFATELSRNKILNSEKQHPVITSMLLIGQEGCGKTFLLDSLQQHISGLNNTSDPISVEIIRPTQQDLVGSTVGSSEDLWISLFSYAEVQIKHGKRVLILLDDIDTLLSLNEMGGASYTRFHVGRRCKAVFLSILDTFRDSLLCKGSSGHLMLVCASRSRCEEIVGRFDRIFTMDQMDEVHREQMILTCLISGTGSKQEPESALSDELEGILSLAVKHSAGRTAFELSQCCRDAILSEATTSGNGIDESIVDSYNILKERLHRLDRMLQTKIPQSLRAGSLDGIVDMVVLTPEELISRLTTYQSGEVTLPLLGADAKRAYESLMNVVITPLCCSEKITDLLYGGLSSDDDNYSRHSQAPKPIRVGALLAGGPGTGKTSLVYHCASVAAQMSRVSLLDVSCTSLIHKEIGGSERAVRRLFEAVRAAAPCILLLDGIENVAPRRGNDCTTEGTMDRVLSTFLTEMDGIGDDGDGASGNVGVIGITYNPDLIDPSLLRPGRLQKTIRLGPLDFEARKDLIATNIKDLEFDFTSSTYFDPKSKEEISQYVAMESAGMSAVETIAICKEASMECLRELNFDVDVSRNNSLLLNQTHFKSALKIMKGKRIT